MVSLIIPCYNSEKTIRQSLESVFAQNYPNLEIIAVNDGSTDQTAHILKEFPTVHTYTFSKNKGVAAALNEGLKHAKGEFIQILDSDDLLLPEKIARQVAFLQQQQADIAYCDYCRFFEEDQQIHILDYRRHQMFDPQIELIHTHWLPPAAYLFRKSVAKNLFFHENLPIFNDVAFFWQLVQNRKVVYCPEILVHYRISENSLSRREGILRYFVDKYQCLQLIEQKIVENNQLNGIFLETLLEGYRDCNRVFVEYDQALFEDCVQHIYELKPRYVPKKSLKMRLVSWLFGYKNAENMGNWYRKIRAYWA